MKLLSTPKFDYLLQASLEVLHFESHEWQEEVAYISDEVRFLHKLHRKFIEKILPEKQQKHAVELQLRLTQCTSQIDKIIQAIDEHEKYLAEILQKTSSVSDELYRTKHIGIKQQVERLFKEFKPLKKEIFHWAEDVMS